MREKFVEVAVEELVLASAREICRRPMKALMSGEESRQRADRQLMHFLLPHAERGVADDCLMRTIVPSR